MNPLQTSSYPSSANRYTWTPFVQVTLVLALLFSTYVIYQNGFSAGARFDDAPNLSGLSSVTGTDSALTFLADGNAGPLGRPIALLTFLLQKHYWPDFTSELIRTNALIHLINALLVTLLALHIFHKNLEFSRHEAIWIAILVTAIWVLHPFNGSAVLMTIQRMTLLAATFTLIGLNLYLRGRTLLSTDPRKAYLLMGSGIIGCTILSSLCKENGALLPFYGLVLEATVVQSSPLNRKQQKIFSLWRSIIFITPIASLLLYSVFSWNDILASYDSRNFTLTERLATESVILWKYAQQIIAPNISLMGPYHDDQLIWDWSFISIIAAAAWVALAIFSIYARRITPLLALGVLWYLSGHLLESTIFPLELYFEHRNYFSSLGIIFIILFGWLRLRRAINPRATWIIAIYPLALGFLLTQITTLWGNQLLAANLWHLYHPKSPRAAQNYSQKLSYNNNEDEAYAVIYNASARMPNDSGLALQALQLGCLKDENEKLVEYYKTVLLRSRSMDYSVSALDAFHHLISIKQNGGCAYLEIKDVELLGNSLLNNNNFSSHGTGSYNLHLELARISVANKDLSLSMHHFESAYKIKPTTNVLSSMFTTLTSAGLYEEALQKVNEARKHPPRNIFKRQVWEKSIENLDEFLIDKINNKNKLPQPFTLISDG